MRTEDQFQWNVNVVERDRFNQCIECSTDAAQLNQVTEAIPVEGDARFRVKLTTALASQEGREQFRLYQQDNPLCELRWKNVHNGRLPIGGRRMRWSSVEEKRIR